MPKDNTDDLLEKLDLQLSSDYKYISPKDVGFGLSVLSRDSNGEKKRSAVIHITTNQYLPITINGKNTSRIAHSALASIELSIPQARHLKNMLERMLAAEESNFDANN